MKPMPIFGFVLAASLVLQAPGAFAHAGHGDEFQASGGINRVEVKPETDALFGIQVSPIESGPDGSNRVFVPVTALVDDNGRQLAFVQYDSFYEPVEVTTGETQGELIEVTEGLSMGEQLVTQGSLSLYAESRKTQAAEAEVGETTNAPAVVGLSEAEHAEADAQGIPHSHEEEHDHAGEHSHDEHDEKEAEGMSKALLAVVGAGVGLLVGAVFMMKGRSSRLG